MTSLWIFINDFSRFGSKEIISGCRFYNDIIIAHLFRKELNTAKAHQNRSAQKITELQQTICTLSFENSQTKQRLAVLEKVSLENFRALFVGNRVVCKILQLLL